MAKVVNKHTRSLEVVFELAGHVTLDHLVAVAEHMQTGKLDLVTQVIESGVL
jgi:hypothetical protein